MPLSDLKASVMEIFESLQAKLDQAVELGFSDEEQVYYNGISTLMDDIRVISSWDELAEIIYKGKSFEEDIDAWMSLKGYTTIGLEWPAGGVE